ncbi:MAG: type II toxin-antitoxin system RelE/ParE family toxin [Candidatus Marsarchaeota archaeon]|nr:type II toxin-antitoxin system RelE/ParE family toxin [Candidatus Marsarchaeota archaeon]
MPYKIILSEEAAAQLEKLDREHAMRIFNKLKAARDNPRRTFEGLSGRKELKLRVGDYRVLAMVMHKENTIFIITIGHRRDVYKKH